MGGNGGDRPWGFGWNSVCTEGNHLCNCSQNFTRFWGLVWPPQSAPSEGVNFLFSPVGAKRFVGARGLLNNIGLILGQEYGISNKFEVGPPWGKTYARFSDFQSRPSTKKAQKEGDVPWRFRWGIPVTPSQMLSPRSTENFINFWGHVFPPHPPRQSRLFC